MQETGISVIGCLERRVRSTRCEALLRTLTPSVTQVIAKNLNETVEETFPGSWTARSNNDGPLIAADCEKSAMTMRFSSVARTAFTSDELKTLVDKTSNETTSMRQLEHDEATDESHLPLPARRNGSGGDLAEGLLCSV
jgi:hypothetical protein